MNNYEFCVDFAVKQSALNPRFKVLDYGCGAGESVALMRAAGLDASGCDPFYEGGDESAKVPDDIKNCIFKMRSGRAPFRDGEFDLVINNQVMEHVPDLDAAVRDMSRILRPGGVCLSLFPHLEIWREGHCNVPFLHRFSKGSRFRPRYAAAFYRIGYFTEGKTRIQWARDFCDWIDRWCYYRPYDEIAKTYSRHLSRPKHIEPEWMARRKPQLAILPRALRMLIARKAAGLVFVTYKPYA